MMPDLGVPAVRGLAIPCIIGAACVKARYPGNYATFTGRAQDERAEIARRVRELAGIAWHAEKFVELSIIRDSDGTPRIVIGEYAWDHVIPESYAAEFIRNAERHAGK